MLLVIAVLVVLAIIAFLYWAGVFAPVRVTVGPTPYSEDIEVAYKIGVGPFTGVGSFYKEIAGLLPGYPLIGVYVDDPRVVQPPDLRWAIGAVVSPSPGCPAVDSLLRQLLKERHYAFAKLPAVDMAVQARMPTKHWITNMLNPRRVYRAIHAYGDKHDAHGLPAIEMTYKQPRETVYFMPMKRNEEYFLPGLDFNG